MPKFSPKQPGETIVLANDTYRVQPHPSAPKIPYQSEGRYGTVWKLRHDGTGDLHALKVYESPRKREQTRNSKRVQNLQGIFGLSVLGQRFLQPQEVQASGFALDLKYALLMPWIDGKTWFEVIGDREELSVQDCLTTARALCRVLSAIEKEGGAHADISSSNVMVQSTKGGTELIDAEDMFLPELNPPVAKPAGSDGYRHPCLGDGGHQWHEHGDRFAGGTLICEMLGWRFPEVRTAADEESYFSQERDLDGGRDTPRKSVLRAALKRWDRRLVPLFDRLMSSDGLGACPTFAEWMSVLNHLHDGRPVPIYDDQAATGPVNRDRKVALLPIRSQGQGLFGGHKR
jgi:serine/threonine protein kinase